MKMHTAFPAHRQLQNICSARGTERLTLQRQAKQTMSRSLLRNCRLSKKYTLSRAPRPSYFRRNWNRKRVPSCPARVRRRRSRFRPPQGRKALSFRHCRQPPRRQYHCPQQVSSPRRTDYSAYMPQRTYSPHQHPAPQHNKGRIRDRKYYKTSRFHRIRL